MRPPTLLVVCFVLFAFLFVPAHADAQAIQQATNLSELVSYPTFYADRPLTLRAHVRVAAETTASAGAPSPSFLEDEQGHRVVSLWKSQQRPEGTIEVTGRLLDLGRTKRDDPRLAGYDVGAVVGQEWPRPGDLFVFAVDRFSSAVDANSPITTIRSLVLEGGRASGRLVTVAGQFRGRNLFGDLPRSPGNSRSDYVLRASGAAIWISGLPPKGRDFEFDPTARVDTDRWLKVTGIVREGHGLMWIEAKSVEMAQTQSTEEAAQATSGQVAPPPAPAPEVLFSVPTQGETDVNPATSVRIQVSRDIDESSLSKRVRVSYVDPPGTPVTGPTSTAEFDERERVLTIKFLAPLERFKTVRVELLEGIKGVDGQMLKPWELTFTVGGK